jgi:hypothetical protein
MRTVTIDEILADPDRYSSDEELSLSEWAEAQVFEWPPLTEEQARYVRNLGR